MLRRFSLLIALALPLIAAAGCGGDDSANDSQTEPVTIEVTFKGDSVTPSGERVEVATGQPIELKVTADRAGEIHVHSNPEQELEYDAGTSTVDIAPIEQPGVIDVESHTLETIIVQLQVE
jgi:hypothetical protein